MLVHSRLHELHASEFPFVPRIEFTCSKFSIFLLMYPRSLLRSGAEARDYRTPVADPGFGQGRGQPAKEGPQVAGPSSCHGLSRDLRAREGHLRLQTLRGPTMSSEGPFGLLRGPLQTLRGPLMNSEGPSGGQ